MQALTRKQKEILDFLLKSQDTFQHPPTLEELCTAMGLKSRGSMHHQIKALIDAQLIEAPARKQRGIRLSEQAKSLSTKRKRRRIAFCRLYCRRKAYRSHRKHHLYGDTGTNQDR